MASSEASIKGSIFWEKVQRFYQSWNGGKGTGWEDANSVCVLVAQPSDAQAPRKANAISLWLTGYELTDTVFFFAKAELHVLSSQKKIDMFRAIAADAAKPPELTMHLHTRPIQQAAWEEPCARLTALLAQEAHHPVGRILQDAPLEASKFADFWNAALSRLSLPSREVIAAWASELAVKSPAEVSNLKLAASISNGILSKLLIPNIEKAFPEKRKTHAELAQTAEDILATPEKISRKLDPELVESTNTTFVQSGHPLSFAQAPHNSSAPLTFDTIVASLGAKYASQSCSVTRTLYIDPPEELLRPVYEFVLQDLCQAAAAAMRPGNPASDVRKAVLQTLSASKYFYLVDALFPDCGSAISIHAADPAFPLDEHNALPLRPGMTLHLRVGFESLGSDVKHPQTGNPMGLLVSDTFIVGESPASAALKITTVPCDWQAAHRMTEDSDDEDELSSRSIRGTSKSSSKSSSSSSSSSSHSSSSHSSSSSKSKRSSVPLPDESDEEIARQYNPDQNDDDSDYAGPQLRRRQRDTSAHQRAELDERYRRDQDDLARRKIQELQAKYTGGGADSSSGAFGKHAADGSEDWQPPKSYPGPSSYPADAQRTQVFVDTAKEIVLLPICGLHVPFHISTIKTVTLDDNELRINFVAPMAVPGGSRAGTSLPPSVRLNPKSVFIRELVFKSAPNSPNLPASYRKITETKARIQARENQEKNKQGLKEQQRLVLVRQPHAVLNDITIRPSLGGRTARGRFECHSNGFRYTGQKGVMVDIIFGNVKHAFYQKAGPTSPLVLLHFHLHHPIMVGKTKTSDVQVCFEVIESSRDLGSRRENDADGIMEEDAERRMRAKYNKLFHDFSRAVREPSRLDFEVPYDDLAFHGVPLRTSVLLKPTLNCLVHLTDMPWFVLTLEEIEVAFFERVQFGLRNFDLVFIYADYKRPVGRIDVIPITSLDPIKKWLTEVNIMWFECTKNFNWKNIMNTIVLPDVRAFWEEGGWKQFAPEQLSDAEVEMEESTDEDDFVPESSSEEEQDDSSDDDYSASPTDSSDEYSPEESDEGEDWEELDRKAAKADRKHKPDWDRVDEQTAPSRPSRSAAPASRAPASRAPASRTAAPASRAAAPASRAAVPSSRAAVPASRAAAPASRVATTRVGAPVSSTRSAIPPSSLKRPNRS